MRRLKEVQQATKQTCVDSTLLQILYYMWIYVKGALNTNNSAMSQHSQSLSKNTGNSPDRHWENRGYGEAGEKNKFHLEKKKTRERYDNN